MTLTASTRAILAPVLAFMANPAPKAPVRGTLKVAPVAKTVLQVAPVAEIHAPAPVVVPTAPEATGKSLRTYYVMAADQRITQRKPADLSLVGRTLRATSTEDAKAQAAA